ncbi:ribonuclease HIII [Streptococcus halotolerans]|uniref:ribonuclease HIII n=1 Tax=Streptococcus halotolerans TaxID=1814128 RepID=UPI0007888B15|nr:ribonuclease HIII [Streptococcus halotolerans]
MNTLVFQLSKTAIQNLVEQLSAYQTSNNNPYVTFAAKHKNATFLAYTSGKVVIQGKGAQDLANNLKLEANPPKSTSSQNALKTDHNRSMIGTDEVGNGSYFGGLAVVASFVKPEDHNFLKSLGVDDSKKMTDQKIQAIAPLLEEKIPHQALLLSPQKYNQVVGKGLKHNAVSVKVALHNQAIFLLLQKGVQADNIVIDAFTSPRNYQKYVSKENNQVTQAITLEEKAEGNYLAVAVSSIIARAMFLENLKTLGEDVGFQLPSGASAKSDKVASQLLAAYGMESLAYTAKLHFANTQKAQALLKK